MLPAKIYSFQIPAGGTYNLPVQGAFFKVLSASGGFAVSGDTFGGLGAIQPGQGLRNTPFNALQFRDTTGGANNLQVLVAGNDFIDDRITGDVSVIDGNKSRSLAGGAFAWYPLNNTSGANLPHSQLFNPAGSGKNLVIDSLILSTNLAGALYIGSYSTLRASGGQVPRNINSGSNASASSLGRVGADAAPTFSRLYGTMYCQPNGLVDFTPLLRRPIVITPNDGFQVASDTAGAVITGVATFFEELIP